MGGEVGFIDYGGSHFRLFVFPVDLEVLYWPWVNEGQDVKKISPQ